MRAVMWACLFALTGTERVTGSALKTTTLPCEKEILALPSDPFDVTAAPLLRLPQQVCPEAKAADCFTAPLGTCHIANASTGTQTRFHLVLGEKEGAPFRYNLVCNCLPAGYQGSLKALFKEQAKQEGMKCSVKLMGPRPKCEDMKTLRQARDFALAYQPKTYSIEGEKDADFGMSELQDCSNVTVVGFDRAFSGSPLACLYHKADDDDDGYPYLRAAVNFTMHSCSEEAWGQEHCWDQVLARHIHNYSSVPLLFRAFYNRFYALRDDAAAIDSLATDSPAAALPTYEISLEDYKREETLLAPDLSEELVEGPAELYDAEFGLDLPAYTDAASFGEEPEMVRLAWELVLSDWLLACATLITLAILALTGLISVLHNRQVARERKLDRGGSASDSDSDVGTAASFSASTASVSTLHPSQN